MTATLNGPLLRERRIQATIALDYAAQILRVGSPTLTRIENGDNSVARTLTLAGLLDLADLIGCNLADLFDNSVPAADFANTSGAPTGPDHVDPETLIGLLHEADNQVSAKDLRTAFNCKSATLRTAAHQAQELLDGTGLRLVHRDDKLFITPVNLGVVTELVTALDRTQIARLGLDNGQARVLKQVLDGRLKGGRKSAYTRGALGLLTRLGMLTTVKDGAVPSEALTYALDVPEQDT